MTIKELIEKLKEFDQDMPVVVNGYEGGFDNPVISTERIKFFDKKGSEWYFGQHEENENGIETVVVGRQLP